MAHFKNAYYFKYQEYMKTKNCELFVLVKDKTTGKIEINGNKDLALNYLVDLSKTERRTSREWVPNKPIVKPPKSFPNLIQNQPMLRSYAAELLRFFMIKKQKFGQVSYNYDQGWTELFC